MTNPTIEQLAFRFRDNASDGVDASPTWLAAQNTNINIDVTGGNVKFRLRFLMDNTTTATASWLHSIRYSIDNYAANITTSSSDIRAADVGSDADATNLTVSRLTGGTGTFYTGKYDESGATVAFTMTASGYTELEYGLEVVAADVTDGMVIAFQDRPNSAVPNIITAWPQITISKSPVFGSHYQSASIGVTPRVIATGAAAVTVFKETITVVVGDLVFASLGPDQNSGAASISGVSDNLGNTWTALTSGTASTAGLWAFYTKVTTGGDMVVTVTAANTNGQRLYLIDAFKGPFAASELDLNPAVVNDGASPYLGPSSGTLSQADELCIGYYDWLNSSAITTTSPWVDAQHFYSGRAQVGCMSQVVASTTAVQPQYTAPSSAQAVIGTASFKKLSVAPDAPTGLTATASSSTQIDLSWTAPAFDGGSAVTGYKIERESPTGGGFSTLVADTGTTSTTYNDTGLTPGGQYNYRVSAINVIGAGTASTADDATTPTGGVADAPTALSATTLTHNSIFLSWTVPPTSDPLVDGYRIDRESPTAGGFSTLVADTGDTTTNYTDTAVVQNTQYNYKVFALNAAGTSAASTASATTTTGFTPNPSLMFGPPYF